MRIGVGESHDGVFRSAPVLCEGDNKTEKRKEVTIPVPYLLADIEEGI
jgi:hypothetical protein